MMEERVYLVARHQFRLTFTDQIVKEDHLANYTPFRVWEQDDSSLLFHLSIEEELLADEGYELIGQFDDDIASIGVFKSKAGNFRFRIAYPGSRDCCLMDVDKSFGAAHAQLPIDENLRSFCLNNCLMLLYAFSTAKLDTLLMHASVIKKGEQGYIFLGKSGTGKSTHSRLWLQSIEGSELLNDDNPVVRIIDGKVIVFGTPWSGKTPCYRNEEALLKGIVKLRQASANEIKRLSLLQAYAAVLPACSNMKWEENQMAGVHAAVEKVVSLVGCYQLDCLPDTEAARLSYATIS